MGDAVGDGARRFQPSLLQVVHGRQAQRERELPRSARGGRRGRARRVSLARRGGRGDRHHLRAAARGREALRERAEGARRASGRRRRHLPADDPRGARRDARVCPHRGSPQRRLRRLLGGGGARAHGVLGREAPHHGGRRRTPRAGRCGEGARGRGDGGPRGARDDRGRAKQGRRVPDEGRARRLLRRGRERRGARVPRGALRRRASALHPLHVGLDGEAEGHPAHERRLPDRCEHDAPLRLRPPRRRRRARRLLVRGRRRLGDGPLLHRLRAARERRDLGDVGGRAGLPEQGDLVGDRRALPREHLLHRADGDSRVHQVGRAVAR